MFYYHRKKFVIGAWSIRRVDKSIDGRQRALSS
jgi:hypothetical protein